jgi:hypothetical protein
MDSWREWDTAEVLIGRANDERVRDYEVTFITESGEPNKQICQRSTTRFCHWSPPNTRVISYQPHLANGLPRLVVTDSSQIHTAMIDFMFEAENRNSCCGLCFATLRNTQTASGVVASRIA